MLMLARDVRELALEVGRRVLHDRAGTASRVGRVRRVRGVPGRRAVVRRVLLHGRVGDVVSRRHW